VSRLLAQIEMYEALGDAFEAQAALADRNRPHESLMMVNHAAAYRAAAAAMRATIKEELERLS
jgi:hypothetical protein